MNWHVEIHSLRHVLGGQMPETEILVDFRKQLGSFELRDEILVDPDAVPVAVADEDVLGEPSLAARYLGRTGLGAHVSLPSANHAQTD